MRIIFWGVHLPVATTYRFMSTMHLQMGLVLRQRLNLAACFGLPS